MDRTRQTRRNRFAKLSNVEIGPAEGSLRWPHAMAMNHRMASCITVICFWQQAAASRGADILDYTGAPGEIPRLAVVRFHLHPRVTAAMLRDQRVCSKSAATGLAGCFVQMPLSY